MFHVKSLESFTAQDIERLQYNLSYLFPDAIFNITPYKTGIEVSFELENRSVIDEEDELEEYYSKYLDLKELSQYYITTSSNPSSQAWVIDGRTIWVTKQISVNNRQLPFWSIEDMNDVFDTLQLKYRVIDDVDYVFDTTKYTTYDIKRMTVQLLVENNDGITMIKDTNWSLISDERFNEENRKLLSEDRNVVYVSPTLEVVETILDINK